MNVNQEALNVIASTLQEKFGFATVSQLDRAIAEIMKRTAVREQAGNRFSISTAIRGMLAMNSRALVEESKDADVEYVRALTTGSTPGSYLVPTIQSDQIIQYLSTAGIARAAGVRVWPLAGVDKLTIPSALAAPTVEYLGQNTAQSASDPSLGQISFTMKTARCLTAIPNELLSTSSPAIDTILAELIGVSFAESEDNAMFSTSPVTGGPAATLYSVAGTTTYNVGNSANGGNLSYADLTAVMWKAAAAKAKGPFVWLMSPRTFWQRVVGLVDSQSRPIVTPDVQNAVVPRLFGYPVYVSPAIPENQSVGSGSNQSYAVFTNPKYIHIGDGQQIEIATSTEFLFSSNQTALRGVRRHDFAYAPAAGICLLKGIN